MTRGMDADAALVGAARSGDHGAFAAIYDRYADRLHDFAYSVLRDRDEAADVTHDTFLIASQRLGQLRDPSKLRAWLFAIARHEALRRTRARGRVVVTDARDLEAAATTSAPPEATVEQAEIVATVWEAAGGLADRDRAVLDLHLRQGLQGRELAEAIGVTPHHADVLMARMRQQVDRSLGALLVARHGRQDCPELQAVLMDWDGTYAPIWRKRVARHVDGCDRCTRRRATFLQPLTAFAAVGVVAAPAALRERTLHDLASVASSPDAHAGWHGDGAGDGFPPSAFPHRARRGLAAVLVAVGVVALVIATIVVTAADLAREPSAPSPSTVPFRSTVTTTTALPAGSNHAPVGPGPTTPTTRVSSSTTTTPTTAVPPTTSPPIR